MRNLTFQEQLWKGQFGNEYITRNNEDLLVASNTALFSKIMSSTKDVSSIIEFGSNIGLNMLALKTILPQSSFSSVEINEKACEELKNLEFIDVYNTSMFDFESQDKFDFTFTKGVLIHISPDLLDDAYNILYEYSKKYIMVCEYYNPTPVEIEYRGNNNALFKRDFAGDLMKKFSDLQLVDYGFVYHADNVFKQDDLTWFLMEKVEMTNG